MPIDPQESVIAVAQLRLVLANQYRAGLAMVRDAVMRCPNAVWEQDAHDSAFWQIAYHTLYFTHLYLQPRVDDFVPHPGHQADVQHDDGLAGPPDPASERPLLPTPYGKEHVLAYVDQLIANVADALEAIDLTAADSGFPWYPVSKLEHQIINVRHLQHHAGQLTARVRDSGSGPVRWVGADPRAERTA
jgi:hypothetical protein